MARNVSAGRCPTDDHAARWHHTAPSSTDRGCNDGLFGPAQDLCDAGLESSEQSARIGQAPNMDIVAFDPAVHRPRWEEFIVASYRSANYVMLSHKFLRWQFFDNPANQTGGYTLWLVEQKGEIIAQLGFVPFQGLTRSSEPVQGAYPINLMVRPEYRSVGLGAILLGRLLKQFPCLVNPGVNEAGATLGEGLGMTNFGFLRRYVAVLDKHAAQALAFNGRLPQGVVEARTRPVDVIAATKLPRQASAGCAFPQPAYGAVRSSDFLRWRYENSSRLHLRVFVQPRLPQRSRIS